MKSKISLFVLLVVILIAGCISTLTKSNKQFILIGVDGVQYNHLTEMLVLGKLPNYQRLIGNKGIGASAQITGHIDTSTAPGNAELFTGLPSIVTGIVDNSCEKKIPQGLTVFERLRENNPNIQLGLVYGKKTCYIPESVLSNAKPVISWWFSMDNSPDSKEVSTKALEFLQANKKNSFFLTLYYGITDVAGHTYGENSKQYDDALINTDQALGILLDWVEENEMKIPIIVTSDHGWNEGTWEHSLNTINTRTIPILSNDSSIVTPFSAKQQCSIAPTIYKYFSVKKSSYTDVSDAACFAMY